MKIVLSYFALLLMVVAAPPARAATHPFPTHAVYAADVIRPTNISQAAMDSLIISYYATWKVSYLRNAGGNY